MPFERRGWSAGIDSWCHDVRAAVRSLRRRSAFGLPTVAIFGVTTDVTPVGEPDRPAIYFPMTQLPIGDGSLVVRTGDPAGVDTTSRREVA